MYPRSLITVSLCILKNWPFCSAETDTGAVAPVEATQVGAEGQAEVVGPTKPFSYYMSQWDTCLPQHNMTRLNCSPCNATLQNYCLSLHHFTSQESHRDQVLPHHPCVHQGFGQDSFKSCYSQGAGSYHQSFLNPDISPHIISHHIALHLPWENGITAQKYPWHPPDCTELSLLAGGSWHWNYLCVLWQTTKKSWGRTSIPGAMEGSLGRASFKRVSIPLLIQTEAPPVLENLLLLQRWGTASRLKNWGAHVKSWSWSLIPFPSPLNTRKPRGLLPALPLLGWQTWASPE